MWSPLFATFALLHVATSQNVTVSSLPAVPGDLSTPVQQRIAYNGPTGMTIAWNTFKQLSKPAVHYGLTPNALFFSASSGSSITYPTSRTWANTVKLLGLLPATTYYYKIESTNSTVLSFKTARVAGDPTPYTAALVIDMGVFGPDGLSERNVSYTGQKITYPLKPGEHTTIQRLEQEKDSYEFVIHPGDFSYADAWLKEELVGYINGTIDQGALIYEGLNEQFYDQLSVVSGSKAYMVAAGNHEANCVNGGTSGYNENICPEGQRNFTGFINRFGGLMPLHDGPLSSLLHRRSINSPRGGSTPQAKPPFWYSFDYGMTHYVIFNTESDLGGGIIGPDELGGSQGDLFDGAFGSYRDEQIDWIRNDLKSVNRFVTPWIVAAGHRPWYVANGFPCIPECQNAFEPLFNEYGVDLVVTGHTHNMQRHAPIANNITDLAGLNNPKAPLYIVNGAGGHFQGLETLLNPLPNYTVWANDTVYGFTKLLFHDRSHLEVQMIESDTGDILDSAVLFKKHNKKSGV